MNAMDDKREAKRKIYREYFSTKSGRFILEDLSRVFGLYKSSVSEYHTNALETFYREGARSVILYILRNCGVFDGENRDFGIAYFLNRADNSSNQYGDEKDGIGKESDNS